MVLIGSMTLSAGGRKSISMRPVWWTSVRIFLRLETMFQIETFNVCPMFRPLRPALERFFGVQTYRTFLQERVSQTASKGSQREGLKLESVLKF